MLVAILKVCLPKTVPLLQGCYPGLCFDVKQHFSRKNLKDSFIVARVIQVYVFLHKIRHLGHHLNKWSKIQKVVLQR